MKKKIVAGNWKMNMTRDEGITLINALKKDFKIRTDASMIVCPPASMLGPAGQLLDGSGIGLGAQNCHQEVKGAYTGEISADMVKSFDADYVILGHSERRKYFGEDDALLFDKTKAALAAGLDVIFCCGELLEDREAKKHFEVVKNQLTNTVLQLEEYLFERIIIAYEPVWAIGTGLTASPEQAQEMHAYIRNLIGGKYNFSFAQKRSILYGGSCNAKNAASLFSMNDVDGGLIGGASLKAPDFIKIYQSL